ncbi:hypothetical protein ABZ953_01255 [Streptomyces sp. NPDC046465]|uniref:hypothetical protein n=1 Tax=Streptomyces sp. NPDC046465 TaxID=3155810 RepID=UPI00340ED93E
MGDIPKSRDAKHPILRHILFPFYRTRMMRLQHANVTRKDNIATLKANKARIRAAREERAYVKQLKKDGTLR